MARWHGLRAGQAVVLHWTAPTGVEGSFAGCSSWWIACYSQIALPASGIYTVTVSVDGAMVAQQHFAVVPQGARLPATR